MKKKLLLSVLVIIMLGSMLFILTGCKNNEENRAGADPIQFESTVELDKKTYIEQLKKIQIKDTNDYFIITEKRKWEVPEHPAGTTVSFTISIPYTLHVDGKDYNGTYQLGDSVTNKNDDNPKYKIQITNLKSNYETEILITKK